MLYGRFHDRFPRIALSLPAEGGTQEVEFIIDTGFDGDITLPSATLGNLDKTPFSPQEHPLADGSTFLTRVYHMTIEWLDEEREIEVLSLETNPLLGTGLLSECHLDMEATEGGEVMIEVL